MTRETRVRPIFHPPPFDQVVETARLSALRRCRGLTESDRARLSGLAAAAAGGLPAPLVTVALVEADHVWFAGAHGLAVEQVPRAGSFCDAVVSSRSPLVVPDGRADPRFWDHKLVSGAAGVRAFAGAPLLDEGGHALGVVAAYSEVPGAFGEGVVAPLVGLAGLVVDFLAERQPAAPAPARVRRWLGVRTRAEAGSAGLIVLSVARDSPALAAGLRPTDILHSIDGRFLKRPGDVTAALAARAEGAATIRYRRAGRWCETEIPAPCVDVTSTMRRLPAPRDQEEV